MAVPDAGSQTASPELPAEDSCGRLRPQPARASNTAPCQILPVLNLGYHLDTDATNTGGKPLQKLDLTVGHQSFDGIGSQADITAATVSVSYDNGKTWTDAHVGTPAAAISRRTGRTPRRTGPHRGSGSRPGTPSAAQSARLSKTLTRSADDSPLPPRGQVLHALLVLTRDWTAAGAPASNVPIRGYIP